MRYIFFHLGLLVFSLSESIDAQALNTDFAPPQIIVKGGLETLFDQGLVRKNEKVIDYWRNFDGNQIRLKKLKVKGKSGEQTFDVLIIIQREGELRAQGDFSANWEGAYLGFAPNIFRWARRFILPHYEKKSGQATLARLKKERDFYNGVSSMVIITKENDISNIVATLRVVRRGSLPENELLDIEEQTGERLPDIPVEILSIDGQPFAVGDWAEVKTYTQSDFLKSEQIDLQPVLMAIFHQYRLFEFGQRFKTLDGQSMPWAASHLTVEAAEAQARLYQKPRFGFKLIGELGEGLFLLQNTIEDYRKITSKIVESDDPVIRNLLDQPPVSGWNYLPVLSPEQHETFYDAATQKPIDGIPRFVFESASRVPFYHHSSSPVKDYELAVRKSPQVFHPFDLLRRLGLSEEDFINFENLEEIADHKDLPSNASYSQYATVSDKMMQQGWLQHWLSNWGLSLIYRKANHNIRKSIVSELNQFYNSIIARGFADPRLDAEAPTKNLEDRLRLVLLDPTAHLSDVNQAVRRLLDLRQESPELDGLLINTLTQLRDLHRRLKYRLFQYRHSRELMAKLNIDFESFISEIEKQIVNSFEIRPPHNKELQKRYEDWALSQTTALVLTGQDSTARMEALSAQLESNSNLSLCLKLLRSFRAE